MLRPYVGSSDMSNDATNVKIEVLDHVVLIKLDISLWSGRTRMRPTDLRNVSGDQIPPETLASLGHKKTCNPKDLAFFNACKKEAERACIAIGSRFMGGYAIPESKLPELANTLNGIKNRFYRNLDEFLQNYDDRVDEWAASHPKWESIIRQAVVPSSVVRNRMAFRWIPVRVAPATADDSYSGDLADETSGLAGQLFREIALQASDTWKRSYEGRPKVRQSALNAVRQMRKKLSGLAFIDPRVSPIVTEIDGVLQSLPKNGHIEGTNLSAVSGLVRLLADEEAMKQHGHRSIENRKVMGIGDAEADDQLALTDDVSDEALAESGVEVDLDDEAAVEEEVATTADDEDDAGDSGWFF